MDISLLFPILILLLFIPIFLSSRKQKRAQAEMQSLQSSLEPGDIVSTTSGLRGTVVDASYEDTIDLEIADGVVTTWVRAAIREKIATDDTVREPVAEAAPEAPAVVEEPAAAPSLEKSAPSLDKAEQPSLEKDDSTNGSPRS
jgi:preprotein translocase subunit YajC